VNVRVRSSAPSNPGALGGRALRTLDVLHGRYHTDGRKPKMYRSQYATQAAERAGELCARRWIDAKGDP
jgi:hypothetical protein